MTLDIEKALLAPYNGQGTVPAHEWKLVVEELGRLQADNARLMGLLNDVLEQCHDEWCSGDDHYGPCRQIREAQKEKRK